MSERIKGCPIPPIGTYGIHGLCFPDTWAGLYSELLVPPTKQEFWDKSASQSDIDAAIANAENTLHSFLSGDCLCVNSCDPPGDLNLTTWDFANAPYFDIMPREYGIGDYGVYQFGRYETVKWQRSLDGFWQVGVKLKMDLATPVHLFGLKVYGSGNSYSGGGLVFPFCSIKAYSAAPDYFGPYLYGLMEFNVYWVSLSFRHFGQTLPRIDALTGYIELQLLCGIFASEAEADVSGGYLNKVEMMYIP